jgi:CheY-like chemotaxis protein
MKSVRLIHWNAAEAEECIQIIADLGYEVVYEVLDANQLRKLRETPPNAIVIDLSRLPSQGRDLGINLRKYKATRHVPIIFIGGGQEKVGRIKEIFPDAIYSTWDRIAGSLEQAISKPLEDPVVPGSYLKLMLESNLRRSLESSQTLSLPW